MLNILDIFYHILLIRQKRGFFHENRFYWYWFNGWSFSSKSYSCRQRSLYLWQKSTAYKNLIILEALKEWLQISETPTAPFDSVCEYIIKDCDAQNKQKLYSNVSYLLRSPGSNITDTVPFASFVKFIAQYGYVPNCQKNIIDLSSTNNDENFEKWFQPFISDAGITQLLSKQPLEITWILRPSVVVGMFSLHQLFNGKIISTSIDFNPTAPIEDNRSFSIVGEKEGLIQAGSIRHLLLDLLDLSGN